MKKYSFENLGPITWNLIRGSFFRGLGIIIPGAVTVWIFDRIFRIVDETLSPLLTAIIGFHIPGLGFITILVIVILIGFLSRNLVGRFILSQFERIFLSIPVARAVYSATRDLLKAFSSGGGKSFRRVLLIEYPRAGLYTVAFQTNEIDIIRNKQGDRMICVYIPQPPNPTSGLMIFVPEKDAHPLAISVEEGLKLVLSGGIVSPNSLTVPS